ncbi:MAG: hypothetical protein ACKVQK_04795 [Burkholderiales bacterium]
MKLATTIVMLLATLLPLFAQAQGTEIYVIAHASTPLSATDIREIYLGDKQFAGAAKLTPLDNASLQNGFLSKALKLTPEKYEKLWTKKSFRDALNPPAMRNSDKEIIDAVLRSPGSVGYISTPPPAGVRVVQKF